MSVDAFKWALLQRQVKGSAKVVLLVLAWRMHKTTGLCCPGIDQIASDCGLERRAVQRQITNLSEAGLVEIIERFGGVIGRKSNRYLLPTYKPKGRFDTLVDPTTRTLRRIGRSDQGDVVTDQGDAATDQGDAATPIKKVKKKKKVSQRASRRVPADFKIDASLLAWMMKHGISNELARRELEKFQDFEFARPYSDWQACFRNWLRRAVEFCQQNNQTESVETTATLAATLGLEQRTDESDDMFAKRVCDEDTLRRYAKG